MVSRALKSQNKPTSFQISLSALVNRCALILFRVFVYSQCTEWLWCITWACIFKKYSFCLKRYFSDTEGVSRCFDDITINVILKLVVTLINVQEKKCVKGILHELHKHKHPNS